ncbi:MAG: hypothetical protein KKG00_03290, partial [Bacteroidetes bacterium]|nr:hypothetical protein [Bacteroidota bacterium]
MKKLFKLRVWLILLAWGSILSCQKSEMESTLLKSDSMIDRGEYARNLVDETIQGSYVVRNGILHFRDFESFDKISEQFKNMNIHDRTNFFSNYGFSSYTNEVRMTQKKLDEAEDETTFNKILLDNQDILDVLDDKTIIPKAGDTFMNDFANREGYLFIGNILYQFGKNFQKIAFDGDVN